MCQEHCIVGEQGKLNFRSGGHVVDIGQIECGWEAGALQDSCKNVSSSRKTVVDFGLNGSIVQKGFYEFYDRNRGVKGIQFIEKNFVPDESFLHAEKYQSSLYIVVEVFDELVGELSQ